MSREFSGVVPQFEFPHLRVSILSLRGALREVERIQRAQRVRAILTVRAISFRAEVLQEDAGLVDLVRTEPLPSRVRRSADRGVCLGI